MSLPQRYGLYQLKSTSEPFTYAGLAEHLDEGGGVTEVLVFVRQVSGFRQPVEGKTNFVIVWQEDWEQLFQGQETGELTDASKERQEQESSVEQHSEASARGVSPEAGDRNRNEQGR